MIAMQRDGQGPLLVFLHGWAGSNSAWDKVVHRLRLSYSCLRLGIQMKKTAPESEYYETLAMQINEQLSKNSTPTAFVAWSFGAVVMWELFRRGIEIPAAVIIGSAGRYLKNEDNPFGVDPKEYRALKIGMKRDQQSTLDTFLTGIRGEMSERADLSQFDLDELKMQLELIGKYDIRDLVATATFPACVIHGEDDRTMPIDLGKNLAGMIKNLTDFHVMEGGHGLPLTHSIETASLIDRFCAGLKEKQA